MTTDPQADPLGGRVMAIDALRGFDMFWIIGGGEVVHAILRLWRDPLPEAVEYHFQHPAWIGFSAWDLIMPLFLFLVGTSMPFSFAKRIERGQTKARLYRKILTRCLILWVLGMAIQGHLLEYRLSTLEVFSNTLQSIAVGYLVAALVLLHLPRFGPVFVTAALLGLYALVLKMVPAPGQVAGLLEPRANVARYLDQLVLGHFRNPELTYAWVLASLGFAATVLLGVIAGQILRLRTSGLVKVLALALFGGACLALGWWWSTRLPIIKHLFTSSMVLWAAGWSFLLLALFYLLIDVLGLRRWSLFFVVIGTNAIAAYAATHLFQFHHVSDVLVKNLIGPAGRYGSLLDASSTFAVVWLILLYLYRKRTFLRV
jgi:predicted acyltransferase